MGNPHTPSLFAHLRYAGACPNLFILIQFAWSCNNVMLPLFYAAFIGCSRFFSSEGSVRDPWKNSKLCRQERYSKAVFRYPDGERLRHLWSMSGSRSFNETGIVSPCVEVAFRVCGWLDDFASDSNWPEEAAAVGACKARALLKWWSASSESDNKSRELSETKMAKDKEDKDELCATVVFPCVLRLTAPLKVWSQSYVTLRVVIGARHRFCARICVAPSSLCVSSMCERVRVAVK